MLSSNSFGSLARSVVKLKKELSVEKLIWSKVLHFLSIVCILYMVSSHCKLACFFSFSSFSVVLGLAWPPFFLFSFSSFFVVLGLVWPAVRCRRRIEGLTHSEAVCGAQSLSRLRQLSRELPTGCNLAWTWLESATVFIKCGRLIGDFGYEPLWVRWHLATVLGRPVVPKEMSNWAQSGQESAKPNLWKEQRGSTERFSDVGGRSWDEASNNVTSEGRPAKGVNSPLCEVGNRQFIFGRASNTSSPRANNLGIRTNMTQPTI